MKKDAVDFRLRQGRRNGVVSECRACEKTARASRDAANPNQKRERDRRHRKTNGYKARNRANQAKYVRKRRASDPLFLLKHRIAEQLRAALLGKKRSRRSFVLVGYTPDELRRHLERQFLPGMTWANAADWHIDHIRPVSSFDLSDPEQLRDCWSLPNLRPLWARDNVAKGARRVVLL